MTNPDETASLVGQITGAYREHAATGAEADAVPGRVLGGDVEGQADAMAARCLPAVMSVAGLPSAAVRAALEPGSWIGGRRRAERGRRRVAVNGRGARG